MLLQNFFSLTFKYIKHNISAKSKNGYGIHSPFVFKLCRNVFSKKLKSIKEIENIRNQLLHSKKKISFTDIGAGSNVDDRKTRKISEIARFSSNKKINKLLFKLVNYLEPETVIEFGTSFGFSTLYMARANKDCKILTVEGVPEIAEIAKLNFKELNAGNIELIESNFDGFLSRISEYVKNKTLIFLDGNHKKESTLKYFDCVAKHISDDSVIVIDDINWSSGMREAWEAIKESENVTLSIDLFFVGIVFFRKDIYKQNFNIRFLV